ncbi:MAG TPA: cold shock domain-containing protein [Thermoanaerobaculia bacterium]|nr:cold shock domain-containing protein [Thermoanaerobaculia bacterium]
MSPPTSGRDDPDFETGVVRWFDARRAYGFLAREAAVDVFFPASAVEAPRPLVAGDHVRFLVIDAPRGLQARPVRLDRPGS